MKNLTLFAVCASILTSSVVAASTQDVIVKASDYRDAVDIVLYKIFKKTPVGDPEDLCVKKRSENASSLWRPQTQKAYGWNDGEWVLGESYVMEYDNKGNILIQTGTDLEGTITRDTNTWNENGMLTSSVTEVADNADSEYNKSATLTREYDPIVTDFITSNVQELWINQSWVPGNCYTQTVTRNSDGYVTEMERAVLFNGEYDPTFRLTIEYGDDGLPSTISESELEYDEDAGEFSWVESGKFTDLEWDAFNGQILSTEDIMSGANRVKKGKYLDPDLGLLTFEVTYEGDNFTAVLNGSFTESGINVKINMKLTHTALAFSGDEGLHGEHGYSREALTTITVMGFSDIQKSIETAIYNGYDQILLEKSEYDYDGESGIEMMLKGEVIYDATEGYPLVWTLQEYDPYNEKMNNTFRAEYSDYTNLGAGIETPVIDSINSPTIYYDLTGRRVTQPVKGIYIRVKGDRREKIIF